MASYYQPFIREEAARMGLIGQVDPRHVEAWMRLEYGTLDHLPKETFREFIEHTIAAERIEPGSGEDLAQSYGL